MSQLALQLDPSPTAAPDPSFGADADMSPTPAADASPKRPPEDGFDVYVAYGRKPGETADEQMARMEAISGPLPLIATCREDAERQAACIAGTTAERCMALQARHWSDELMEMLAQETRDSEASLRKLREMHAKILGCTVEELDARIAADKAKEDAERAERRAAAPKRPARGKASPAGDASPIGAARLTDRQRELLSNVRVDGNIAIYVPEERIADWAALKTVLLALGGTWKTKKKGFEFPEDLDAQEAVRLALETGEIIDPIAAGFFPTPDALADRVVALAEIQPGHHVLEPSAGRGAIALAVRRACPEAFVVCVEALEDNAQELRRLDFSVIAGNFIHQKLVKYDRIVANPPFGKRQDIEHVRKMLDCLKPDGRLVSIMSAGVVYRQDRTATEFRALVERHGGWFEENPDGSFIESGTGVRTVTLVIPRGAP